MMRNLPVTVSDEDIEEMFNFADKDSNGKLSFDEFKVMLWSHTIYSHKYR